MIACKNHSPPNRQFACKGGSDKANPYQADDKFISHNGRVMVTCQACRDYGKLLKQKQKRIKDTPFNLVFVSEGHRLWFRRLLNGN